MVSEVPDIMLAYKVTPTVTVERSPAYPYVFHPDGAPAPPYVFTSAPIIVLVTVILGGKPAKLNTAYPLCAAAVFEHLIVLSVRAKVAFAKPVVNEPAIPVEYRVTVVD